MRTSIFKKLSAGLILLLILLIVAGCAEQAQTSTTQEPYREETHELQIRFIDVGQADAALLSCDGEHMLIDGGNKTDSGKIYSILKREDIMELALVIATHPHEDHIGGIAGGLSYAGVNQVWSPVTSYDSKEFETLQKKTSDAGGKIRIPAMEETFSLGSAEITVLGLNASESVNDMSIVVMVTYGDNRFLFMGDAERPAEQALLDLNLPLQADVLKVGHHGSNTSTSWDFLQKVMPEYAVISAGRSNEYGYPKQKVLNRLADTNVTVYRTDLQGDIYMTSDGKNISITTQYETTDDVLMLPGQAPEEPADAYAEAAGDPSAAYVVNVQSGKFHVNGCDNIEDIRDRNKMYYDGEREDLIAMEYIPCGGCRP